MAKLYGNLISDKGKKPLTKTGNKSMRTHIGGWNKGIEVNIGVDDDGIEYYTVYETGGSNNPNRTLIYETNTNINK